MAGKTEANFGDWGRRERSVHISDRWLGSDDGISIRGLHTDLDTNSDVWPYTAVLALQVNTFRAFRSNARRTMLHGTGPVAKSSKNGGYGGWRTLQGIQF